MTPLKARKTAKSKRGDASGQHYLAMVNGPGDAVR